MASNIVREMMNENMMDGYEKLDLYNEEILDKLSSNYKSIIKLIGEDPDREGLLKTPERVAKAMLFLMHGYDLNPVEMLQSAMFKEDYKEMVIVKDIEIYSMCEHHMIPFFGKAHVAYIPNGYMPEELVHACGAMPRQAPSFSPWRTMTRTRSLASFFALLHPTRLPCRISWSTRYCAARANTRSRNRSSSCSRVR